MGTPRRVLVVGATGLVGSHLVRAAQQRGDQVTGAARNIHAEASVQVDLLDRVSLDAALASVNPEIVALCSAWPWVDGCERDPARSLRENVDTVANAIAATRGSRATLLWFSTDHVFDGSRPYHLESDAVNPVSVYARHKLQAERLLDERGNALIARTSYVFGAERARKNFVYRVIDAASQKVGTVPLSVPRGQAGAPTWAGWLADSALELIDLGQRSVIHLTGPQLLTKAAWAQKIASALGFKDFEVREVDWEQAGQVAPRPESVFLKSEKHALVQPPLDDLLMLHRDSLLNP
jgi:dTDP-4-dehydrorhamnose reductase